MMKTKFILFWYVLFVGNFQLFSKVISIETLHTGLYLKVMDKGNLIQLHYGKKLADNNHDYFSNLLKTESLGYNSSGRDAYSTFGTGNVLDLALQLVHADGNMTTILRYLNHEVIQLDPNRISTIIKLKDADYPLFVDLVYTCYLNEDVIEISSVIQHNEKGLVRIDKSASANINIERSSYYLTQFSGEWGDEMHMTEEKLTRGIKSLETKKGVRTTQSENPSFVLALNAPLQENEGEVIMGALAWSGNHKFTFQIDQFNKLTLIGGLNNFNSNYYLAPQKPFETPKMILTYSDMGSGNASRNLHRYARAYKIRDGNRVRPVVLNSWEGAYFTFTEDVLTKMMDGAADMGVEMFVLDDGWFGNKYPRNDDKKGLGDWQVNTSKLPRGLDYLINYATKKNMQFGLWLEPEMVNPESDLAKKHPEWILGDASKRERLTLRSQLILDLANPKVQDFIFETVDGLLSKHKGIAYIKWDANSHVQNFGSNALDADKQSHIFTDYVLGLYRVYDKLMKKHPNVIFQACSSGGGRVDYGSLAYHHEFWPSDNTDAYSRLFIQWGTNYIYPTLATASHVSDVPNHQTKQSSPLKMRIDLAMCGRMGLELLPKKLTSKELDYLKESVKTYKRIRTTVQLGDQYRILSPYANDRTALMYVNEDKSHALLFAFSQKVHYRYDLAYLKLNGLDPNKKYKLTEINKSETSTPQLSVDGKVFSGDFLMNYGITLNLRYQGESAAIELTEVISTIDKIK